MEGEEQGGVFFGEIESEAECGEEGFCRLVELPVEGCHEGAEVGERGFWEPYVWLGGVGFGTDFVAFLDERVLLDSITLELSS